MVSRHDLNEINELNQEVTTIEAALENFAAGGGIVGLTVSGGPPDQMPFQPWVNIRTIDYISPETAASVRAEMEAHLTELKAKLAQLGLTE